MISLSINNLILEFNHEMSVLEACSFIGLQISRFCFHESLAIAGNCRMCLVELFDQLKPVASCVQPATHNLEVYTDSILVKKSKENVLELLLLNHPLDCPVCERGGECELQDHALSYASTFSRFFFKKRSVENKNFGFFIETVMNRCIHCTRCIRYFEEVSNFKVFGTLFRGIASQIGHLKNDFVFKSELFGNVIDLCPVGALNSKHYSNSTKRPWELKIISTIDLTDSIGSNIYMYLKNNSISKIMPKLNKNINENIISDKSRFCFDGNIINRLFIPNFINMTKQYTSYDLINYLANILSKKNFFNIFFVDNNLDLNSLNIVKKLSFIFGNSICIHSISNNNNNNININFLFNKIIDIDKSKFKACFIFGTNIRFESVLLNLKIRKKILNENLNIFIFGLNFKNTFSFNIINLNKKIFNFFFEGKTIVLCKFFIFYKSPLIFISNNLNYRGWNDSRLLLIIKKIIPTAIIINIKQGSNSNGICLLNIKNISRSIILKSSLFCGLNLKENLKMYDYFYLNNRNINFNRFLFQTHKSNELFKANLNIPILSDFESENIFLNLEDRPQKTSIGLSYSNSQRHTIYNLMSHLIFYSSIFLYDSYISNLLVNILTKIKEYKSQNFINEILTNKLKFQDILPLFSYFFFNNYSFLISFESIKNNDKNFYCNTILSTNSLVMNEYSIKNKLTQSNFEKF